VITSNADFESQGWSGSGLKEDPYIIESLAITSLEIGIDISDTTVYFEIQDCAISSSGSSSEDGIYLNNVTHGTVENCIVNSYKNGLRLNNSSNCKLNNNTSTSNSDNGFTLWYSYNCMLTDNTATNNLDDGFLLADANNCVLTSNTATSNSDDGFYLWFSDKCTMINNTLENNGLRIIGDNVSHWLHDISGNIVNGKLLGYFASITDFVVDGTKFGQVILVNCSGVTVEDGAFKDVSNGVELVSCSNCTLANNTVSNNSRNGFYLWYSNNCKLINNTALFNKRCGFFIHYSDNCKLINNIATNNRYGFSIVSSHDCMLLNNTATNNSMDGFPLISSIDCTLVNNTTTYNSENGFDLKDLDNCTLFNNTVSNNSLHGFVLDDSTECELVNNTITHNSEDGIYLHYSDNCLLFLNRLGYNGLYNAEDDGYPNSWDNGTHGNYWTDYDGSGQYTIPGRVGSIDNHPFFWDYAPPDTIIPSISHPSDVEYEEGSTGHSITWVPSDDYPLRYEVYRDSSLIESGYWDGSEVTINIDGLSLGIHNYTLVVYDRRGNSASDTVFVSVISGMITTTNTTTSTTPTDNNIPVVFMFVSIGVIMIVIIIFYIRKGFQKHN
jgi:parallel beta-helix repeat protein